MPVNSPSSGGAATPSSQSLVNNSSANPTSSSPAPASPAITLDSLPAHLKKPNAATQAMVNQLVRREFDKSLQQCEFPRGTPDLQFVPNANHMDFLMCLGLEDVVRSVQECLTSKHLQKEKQLQKSEQKSNENDPNNATASTSTPAVTANVIEIKYEYPYMCANCGTDYTPVWRRDKNNTVLCEKCLKTLERKQTKQEHGQRLKQIVVKVNKDREVFEKQVLAEQQQATLLAEQERAERLRQQREQQMLMAQQVQAQRLAEQQRLEQQRLERIEQQRQEALRIQQQQQQQQRLQRMQQQQQSQQNKTPSNFNNRPQQGNNVNRNSMGQAQQRTNNPK